MQVQPSDPFAKAREESLKSNDTIKVNLMVAAYDSTGGPKVIKFYKGKQVE